jgi:hypothetical protein
MQLIVYESHAGSNPVRPAKVFCRCGQEAQVTCFSSRLSRVRIPPSTPRGSRQDGLSHRIFTTRIAGTNPAYPAKARARNIDGDVRGSYPRKWRASRHGPTNIQGWQKPIATLRIVIARQLLQQLPHCPFCGSPPGWSSASTSMFHATLTGMGFGFAKD